MVKQLTKVIYKPDSQSTEEYTIIVDPEAYEQWKGGDHSIPISQVVDSFDVFHSTQGKQGRLGQASKQQLENVFGTSKDIDVVEKMLELGEAQTSSRVGDDSRILKSLAHGGYQMDTRGSGAQTTGA